MIDRQRLSFECEYVGVKSKKGFRGNWESHYTVRNIKDTCDKGIFIDTHTFVGLKCFKGKSYKLGDKLTFKANIELVNDKYVIKYIRDVEKVIVNYGGKEC